jgi:hypothetical protein
MKENHDFPAVFLTVSSRIGNRRLRRPVDILVLVILAPF